MKILLVANKSPWPPKDGGSLATFHLAKALSQNGAQVTILAMNTSRHPVQNDSVADEITGLMNFSLVNVDTRIKISGVVADFFLPGKPYIAKRFVSVDFLKELQKLVSKEEYDIIQFEGLYTLQYRPLIQIPFKTKVAYRPHNAEHKIWAGLANNETNLFKKVYFGRMSKKLKSFEQKLLNLYDFLVAISEEDKNIFFQMGNTKLSITTPFGIFPGELPAFKKSTDSHLFFIGALDWIPNMNGLEWFVKNVWPGVKVKHPYLKFFVAGRNMTTGFIRVLTSEGIHFEGEVENSAHFIQSHGTMVVPLFFGGGMRVKIIEAMAHGKPVIATSKAAEGIQVTPDKNILLADTSEEFSTAIDKLIFERAFADEIGREARLFALANFNNFDIAKALIQFYRSA